MLHIKNHRTLLTVILLWIAVNSFGQTFSAISDSTITSLTPNIWVMEDGYLTTSTGYDSTESDLIRPLIVQKYNSLGQLVLHKLYHDSTWLNTPLVDANLVLNDSLFVFAGTIYYEPQLEEFASLVFLNLNGDTLLSRVYSSPYYTNSNEFTNWNRPTSIVADDQNENIYMVSQVVDYPPIQNNFVIRKINSQGEVVWTYVNPINPNYYTCSALIYQGTSLWVLLAGWGLNSFNKVVQLNTETGVFVNEIVLQSNPNNLAYAEEFYIDTQGFIIACRSFNSDNNTIPALYKMDYDGNLLWFVQPSGTHSVSQNNDHLVQSSDGGFVSCGVKYDEEPSWLYPNDPAMNNTMKRIWLWKVDANGNFLWQRFYSYYDFDDSPEYFHLTNIAHDMKATPDGGFIMAGEASAACINYPTCDDFTQQGWLLKVDACGCLVPGCDPNCIVSVEEKQVANENKYFRFGPNPVGDLLNLYIPPLPFSIKELTFSLVDMNGRKIKDFQFQYDNTTYMIDAQSLAAGNYILSLTKDGQVLQRERIIKN